MLVKLHDDIEELLELPSYEAADHWPSSHEHQSACSGMNGSALCAKNLGWMS
jgi:hypothetical protein